MPDTTTFTKPAGAQKAEHFDVADRRRRNIWGRGAYHLTKQCPGTSFVVLETAGELRRHVAHPPLSGHPLRQRPLYVRLSLQAVDRCADRHRRGDPGLHGRSHRGERSRAAHPLPPQDHFGPLVERGQSLDIEGTRTDTGEAVRFTANFLWMCQGYYRHSQGYTPEWPGMDEFKGRIVHPQTWPEDLDYKDKKVVVIGSGATAATLIPAMAADCGHITMLQRSPTYFSPAATPTNSPTRCANSRSTRHGSTRSCAARSCTIRPSSPVARSRSRRP